MFIVLPLIFVPVPWLFFGQGNGMGEASGWKSFSEFLSGFLFSTSWAVVGIAYHLGAVTTISFIFQLFLNFFFFH
jgi:hypothetical protein